MHLATIKTAWNIKLIPLPYFLKTFSDAFKVVVNFALFLKGAFQILVTYQYKFKTNGKITTLRNGFYNNPV